MKKLSKYIKFLYPVVIILLVAKLIGIAVLLVLPKVSLEKQISNEYSINFKSYQSDKQFGIRTKKEKLIEIKKPTYDLKDLMLKAIYKNQNAGVIVIVDIKTKKAIILGKGEAYKGYKLVGIYSRYVVFLKNKKRYTLKLYDDTNTQEDASAKEKTTGEIKTQNVAVSKREILKYTSNFDSIWRNISIDDVKKGGKLVGFKVRYIRRHSTFGKLGLKKGDIITKINSEPLTSYSQVFEIYNNIGEYNYLTITVLRDGKEKDFDYEIR